MLYTTLVPAYGRDYKSQKEVRADWDSNKDFMIQDIGHPYNGKYINKADAATTPGVTYNIRYARLTKVLPVKV